MWARGHWSQCCSVEIMVSDTSACTPQTIWNTYRTVNSHWRDVGYSLEAGGVTDHLVQSSDDVSEAGSHVAVLLPTVQHELVQSVGAVHGWRQTVILLDGVDHLQRRRLEKLEKCIFLKIKLKKASSCFRSPISILDGKTSVFNSVISDTNQNPHAAFICRKR